MTANTVSKIQTLIAEALELLEKAGVKPGSHEQTARAALRQAAEELEATRG